MRMRFIVSLFPWLAVASTLAQAAPIEDTTTTRAARIPFKDRISASLASASTSSASSSSPSIHWYRADPTTTQVPSSSSSSTSTIHWYKADPTTTSAVAAPSPSLTADGWYTGTIHSSREHTVGPWINSNFGTTEHWPETACQDDPRGPSIYKNAKFHSYAVWVSEAFLAENGASLLDYCGQRVTIRGINTPSHTAGALIVVGSMGAPLDYVHPNGLKPDDLVEGKAQFKFYKVVV
ncbi:hypothetical protein JCM10207_000489 [Rhodosporidiobolus poonsookiae]